MVRWEGIATYDARVSGGVWNLSTLVGTRLVIASSHQHDFIFAPIKLALVISGICLFFLSETLFCCGVWAHVVSWMMSCSWKYSLKYICYNKFTAIVREENLQDSRNWVLIILWDSWIRAATSLLCFNKYNQVMRAQPSTNITNHRKPEVDAIGAGPQAFEWIVRMFQVSYYNWVG